MRAKAARKLRQIQLEPYPDLREEMKERISVIQSERDQEIRDAREKLDTAHVVFENRCRKIVRDTENKVANRRQEKLKKARKAA